MDYGSLCHHATEACKYLTAKLTVGTGSSSGQIVDLYTVCCEHTGATLAKTSDLILLS
jgi:hypothetical protein